MAERKAVNKYYPPDWDPRKGSANKRVGQHPLRDRAKKLSQGILVIRFELPYNIWCGGCGSHVGMGVRYNAEKTKVGNYYSTPMYKFRMKCHLCDNYFEIQTDPKNHDYVILNGARRKEQRWDPVANEQIVPEDKATQKKMAMDAMYKLEHGSDDVQKGKDKKQSLAQLETSRLSRRDDYLLNRKARDMFRTEKKQLKAEAEADQAILDRGALDIELLDETDEDRNLAGLLRYSVTSSFEEKQKAKRRSIEEKPLFQSTSSFTPTATATPLSSLSPSTSSADSNNSSDHKTSNEHQHAKSRLGQILKTTGKDPFRLEKSTQPFKASRIKLSSLGIRIKSSKVSPHAKCGNVNFSSPNNKIESSVEDGNEILSLAASGERIQFPAGESIQVTKTISHSQSESPEITSFNIAQISCHSSEVSPTIDTKHTIDSHDLSSSYCKRQSCDDLPLLNSSKSSTCDTTFPSKLSSYDSSLTGTSSPSPLSSPKNSALASLMVSYEEDGTSDSSES